ncbi:MAG: ribonuclease R [Bacilli bacterium]|nr:ribonuclease R [Bacilli bacterium]MDD4406979.1 ribonuclease R [Bacilli bacterium]
MNEEIKTKVLNVIYNEQNPIDAIDISKKTNISLKDICESLIELEKELKIRVTRKHKYTKTDFIFDKITIVKNGVGYVNNDILINNINLKNAINGDNVVVELIGKNEGKVLKILSHEKNYEVGRVIVINNKKYIKLDDIKKKNILLLVNDNVSIVEGHKVAVKIGSIVKRNIYKAEEIKIIGHVNDPGIDILSKAVMFDIETVFPEEVIKEVNNKPSKVLEKDLYNRKDLRNETIFTIDGDDAKDLDDAISLKVLPNGNYLLGVHIADVGYYVKENSELDKEAYRRGTSCYLADRVIPQLPSLLSNGICSLNENADRLTKSCVMEFDQKGKLVNYDIFDSIINSKKRMTYQKVNDCLENKNNDYSYEPFIQDLKSMQKLSNILRKKRENNGCINFDSKEMKIIVDENGKAIDVIKKERIESENLIEDFMIAANVTVATHINYMDLPFVYRTHGEPNIEKLEEFFAFVRLMKEKITKLPNNMHPKVIRNILEELKDSPNYEIYSNLLLRCMQKAVYDVNNIGHFGLSLENYTHFTSPIRRYPDLLVHRLLDKYNKENFLYNEERNETLLKYLTIASRHSSIKEQNADKCEREVNKMKSAEYMENHIGEVFTGKITGVTHFGFYVDIYNGIEGLVKLTDLNNAFFNNNNYTIYTNDGNYKIGDIIDVIVDSSNKEISHINLSLANKPKKNKILKKVLGSN